MTTENKVVSRQKPYFAGNIASKGKRAIFPANVGLFMLTFKPFSAWFLMDGLFKFITVFKLGNYHNFIQYMSHKAKLYLKTFQVLEPTKYINMKLVDLVIVKRPCEKL